jgi:hypothetical protein
MNWEVIAMNSYFDAYIRDARAIAEQRGVEWDVQLDAEGVAVPGAGWNLTKMVGDSPPPTIWLNDFGTDRKTVEHLNSSPAPAPLRTYRKTQLSREWQDLLKACAVDQLFVRRNTCPHVLGNVARPLRVLATCCANTEPAKITVDNAIFAIEVARKVWPSGKLADLIFGVIRSILDTNHLTDAGPICPSLVRDKKVHIRASKFIKSMDEIRSGLEERKNAEKLPERRAFWELSRIAFTEQPRSFLDLLRFAQAKLLILTGLRDGECVMLPADWKRYRDHFDSKRSLVDQGGGISKSLMLRHFAEKQRVVYEDSIALFETVQFVPLMFEDILTATLDEVGRATEPLRRTLRRQIETGRTLPQFELGDLVRAAELYTYLTGNPFVTDLPEDSRRRYVTTYQRDYNPDVFDELRSVQLEAIRGGRCLAIAVYMYFRRFKGAPLRKANGAVWEGKKDFTHMYLRIGEVEEFLKSELPTKQSDLTPFKLVNGELSAWELMFLMPKRALAEGRNAGLCDVTRVCAVGRVDRNMVSFALSADSKVTLFETYGQTDPDRELKIRPHSLRHLQNTELFRLAVADTIITKRFNRRRVAQSYDYDHRSLSEELDMIDLKPEVEARLGEKSATVARLIKSGKARGPIVEAFRTIQETQGEQEALEYLRAEADGFHSTPYGHCINSFTVDPCPQHLECFNGCRHLSATDLTENRHNLVQLEARLDIAVKAIESRKKSIGSGSSLELGSVCGSPKTDDLILPERKVSAVPFSGVGMENQLNHAKTRLAGVRKLLATPPGHQVFPDGPDLSRGPRKPVGRVLDDIL